MPDKSIDVVAVGSWTNFDHLFQVNQLPMPGDTVQIISPIDIVEKVYWGGCAPNNAVAAAKLGAASALVSVVGRDFRDRGYKSYLEDLAIDLRGTIVLEDALCGHSFLFSEPSGDAICISHIGAAAFQAQHTPNEEVLTSSKVAVINYVFDEFTLRAARLVSKTGGQVIVSGALMTAPQYAQAMVSTADILVCTEYELDRLCSYLHLDDEFELFNFGIQALISTRGKSGSLLTTPDSSELIHAGQPDRIVDPVGAGDSFVGGVAAGLAFELPLDMAVKLGAVVASYVIEAEGCQTSMPTKEQVASRLNRDFGIHW